MYGSCHEHKNTKITEKLKKTITTYGIIIVQNHAQHW